MENKKAFPDAGPSTEVVSIKSAFVTIKGKAQKALEQLVLLQQKHRNPQYGWQNRFDAA